MNRPNSNAPFTNIGVFEFFKNCESIFESWAASEVLLWSLNFKNPDSLISCSKTITIRWVLDDCKLCKQSRPIIPAKECQIWKFINQTLVLGCKFSNFYKIILYKNWLRVIKTLKKLWLLEFQHNFKVFKHSIPKRCPRVMNVS